MSDKPFRTGRSAAKRAAKEQKDIIARQRKQDELERLEAEDFIARRRGRSGGRSLLLNPSQGGSSSQSTPGNPANLSNNLGGTL